MKVIVIVLGALILVGMVVGELQRQKQPPVNPAENAAYLKAANVAIALKDAMRDPDSFRLSTARIIDKSNAVCFKYRARNGFGGMDIGRAVLSSAGKFKSDDMDGFVGLWNRECVGKLGRDYTDEITFILDHPRVR